MRLTDIALNNLRRRKLKNLFLILGLVFGVATVVTLMSITEAMKFNMNEQLSGIGSKVVVKPKTDKLSFSYGPIVIASGVAYDIKELTYETLDKIKALDVVNVIAPKLLASTNVNNKQSLVVGIEFGQELNLKSYWKITGQIPKSENHLLVGSKVSETLGIYNGATLKIKDKEFVVSGILAETASEEDGLIFMHLPVLQQLISKPNSLTFIEMNISGGEENVDSVVNSLRDLLPEANVTPVKEAVEARKQLVDRFSNFSLIISIIVTIIGGLIILSTMMSSVNERTREIGIFRAIGFRKSHILKIIMVEAAAISIVGGFVGYFIGIVFATFVTPLVTQLQLNISLDLTLMFLIITGSLLTGLLASIYPAVKASKLEPAQALRFI